MDDIDVSLVFEHFFEFGDELVVQFYGGYVGGLAGKFLGENSVSWPDFDYMVIGR